MHKIIPKFFVMAVAVLAIGQTFAFDQAYEEEQSRRTSHVRSSASSSGTQSLPGSPQTPSHNVAPLHGVRSLTSLLVEPLPPLNVSLIPPHPSGGKAPPSRTSTLPPAADTKNRGGQGSLTQPLGNVTSLRGGEQRTPLSEKAVKSSNDLRQHSDSELLAELSQGCPFPGSQSTRPASPNKLLQLVAVEVQAFVQETTDAAERDRLKLKPLIDRRNEEVSTPSKPPISFHYLALKEGYKGVHPDKTYDHPSGVFPRQQPLFSQLSNGVDSLLGTLTTWNTNFIANCTNRKTALTAMRRKEEVYKEKKLAYEQAKAKVSPSPSKNESKPAGPQSAPPPPVLEKPEREMNKAKEEFELARIGFENLQKKYLRAHGLVCLDKEVFDRIEGNYQRYVMAMKEGTLDSFKLERDFSTIEEDYTQYLEGISTLEKLFNTTFKLDKPYFKAPRELELEKRSVHGYRLEPSEMDRAIFMLQRRIADLKQEQEILDYVYVYYKDVFVPDLKGWLRLQAWVNWANLKSPGGPLDKAKIALGEKFPAASPLKLLRTTNTERGLISALINRDGLGEMLRIKFLNAIKPFREIELSSEEKARLHNRRFVLYYMGMDVSDIHQTSTMSTKAEDGTVRTFKGVMTEFVRVQEAGRRYSLDSPATKIQPFVVPKRAQMVKEFTSISSMDHHWRYWSSVMSELTKRRRRVESEENGNKLPGVYTVGQLGQYSALLEDYTKRLEECRTLLDNMQMPSSYFSYLSGTPEPLVLFFLGEKIASFYTTTHSPELSRIVNLSDLNMTDQDFGKKRWTPKGPKCLFPYSWEVNLSHNFLMKPPAFEMVQFLTVLNLSQNRLRDLTFLRNHLNQLIELDISHNELEDLSPVGEMRNQTLRVLNISNNFFKDTELPFSSSSDSPQEKELTNAAKAIVHLNNLHALTNLDVSGNCLGSLNDLVLPNLVALSANSCGLRGDWHRVLPRSQRVLAVLQLDTNLFLNFTPLIDKPSFSFNDIFPLLRELRAQNRTLFAQDGKPISLSDLTR